MFLPRTLVKYKKVHNVARVFQYYSTNTSPHSPLLILPSVAAAANPEARHQLTLICNTEHCNLGHFVGSLTRLLVRVRKPYSIAKGQFVLAGQPVCRWQHMQITGEGVCIVFCFLICHSPLDTYLELSVSATSLALPKTPFLYTNIKLFYNVLTQNHPTHPSPTQPPPQLDRWCNYLFYLKITCVY